MGGNYWNKDSYEDRQKVRASTGASAFQHHDDVVSGKVTTALHEALDPSKLKNGVREARDSDQHPNSVPIIFGLDVTGSMRRIPHLVQSKLGELMSTILTKGYLADPQLLFAGIGDSRTDRVPLQLGQFESGLEIEDDLTKLYIEGQGGGTGEEGYEMLLLFAARHTATDAWEKRQRKGYVFITGDELPYEHAAADSIHRVFGGELPAVGIPLDVIVKEALERYHVYFILPSGSYHAADRNVFMRWTELLGAGHVLRLDDPAQICELVALTIGLNEGTASANAIESENKVIQAAIDPVLEATQNKISAAVAAGDRTARL